MPADTRRRRPGSQGGIGASIRLVLGVPLILVLGVLVMAIVVDLLGGIIFDFDVSTVYRNVFRKLDEMISEMEELWAEMASSVQARSMRARPAKA
jgi:hypothetical protein